MLGLIRVERDYTPNKLQEVAGLHQQEKGEYRSDWISLVKEEGYLSCCNGVKEGKRSGTQISLEVGEPAH